MSSNGVTARQIVKAWGRILSGYQPNLSIEITKECPLPCPGCYAHECIFAQTTACISADLERRIAPCQFGGDPDCNNCGCIASAGLDAIDRHRLPGDIPVGRVFTASAWVGRSVARLRRSA